MHGQINSVPRGATRSLSNDIPQKNLQVEYLNTKADRLDQQVHLMNTELTNLRMKVNDVEVNNSAMQHNQGNIYLTRIETLERESWQMRSQLQAEQQMRFEMAGQMEIIMTELEQMRALVKQELGIDEDRIKSSVKYQEQADALIGMAQHGIEVEKPVKHKDININDYLIPAVNIPTTSSETTSEKKQEPWDMDL